MNIAIVGATGLVGREIINLCEEFLPKDASYTLFASSNSAGKNLKINGIDCEVKELTEGNIESYDISLFSAGGESINRKFLLFFILKYFLEEASCSIAVNWLPLILYFFRKTTYLFCKLSLSYN